MSSEQFKLTTEQELVVNHPLGSHARVLAVAGSGKSITMAYRIRQLVQKHGVKPNQIQVLMFNALARKQFSAHLAKTGLAETSCPDVNTFHSFSFQVINDAIKRNILPADTQFWLADKTELIWLTVKRTINDLERAKRIPVEKVDPEEALNAISLWKGSLTPPSRAGTRAGDHFALVYKQFEQTRLAENAITFDDFVPIAIDLLENQSVLYQRYCRDLQHLIVDEYQDVNFGQQRLIEILASESVDVMVVGDDDQTIYEWRGARPNFIIHDFAQVFNDHPVKDYRLSRSFRFGPIIAQCAANLIAENTKRVQKPLIASNPRLNSFIQVYDGGMDSTKSLADQVIALTQTDKVKPAEIVVLGRLFAQMDNLEAEFLTRGIPYRVDGQEPFYRRKEIRTLLDYIRLASDLRTPLSDATADLFYSVANRPSRMLSRSLLNQLVSTARQNRLSPSDILQRAVNQQLEIVSRWQSAQLGQLLAFLNTLHSRINTSVTTAGDLLTWMVRELDYLAYFQDYYGKGENSDEKAQAVVNFIRYVDQKGISPRSLLDQLSQLDTTQGKPEEELIVFTTIFRTKGLEFDYVLIPQCDENVLPYLRESHMDIFDTNGLMRGGDMSQSIENERRLFYVAITRARKGVFIGTSLKPSRFVTEIRHPSTKKLMQSVIQLAGGNLNSQRDLLDLAGNGQIQEDVLKNLTQGYLADLNQAELANALRRKWAEAHMVRTTA